MKRIKLMMITCFILLYSGVSLGKTIVFSDIDDTIKLAYTLGGLKGYAQFLKKIPFYEMRDTFNEIKMHETNETNSEVSFFYISAAPKATFKGDEWIKEHNFPIGPVILKTRGNSGPTYDYKYNNIKAIILDQQKKHGDLKIIFFGDNSQHDANVYSDLTKNLALDAEIFIRDVATHAQDISEDLPVNKIPGVNYFLSEVELRDFSYFHFLSNTLWDKIIKKHNEQKLIPDYIEETLVKRFKEVCRSKIVDLVESSMNQYKAELVKCGNNAKEQARDYFSLYHSRY